MPRAKSLHLLVLLIAPHGKSGLKFCASFSFPQTIPRLQTGSMMFGSYLRSRKSPPKFPQELRGQNFHGKFWQIIQFGLPKLIPSASWNLCEVWFRWKLNEDSYYWKRQFLVGVGLVLGCLQFVVSKVPCRHYGSTTQGMALDPWGQHVQNFWDVWQRDDALKCSLGVPSVVTAGLACWRGGLSLLETGHVWIDRRSSCTR